MRSLVTGISGFVGGHLAELLLANGDSVAGLSASGRWPESLEPILAERVPLRKLDLVNTPQDDFARLLADETPEVIYHLAAQANPQSSVNDPKGTWALNLGGTLSLLEAVKASKLKPRVVIVGSGVCYGNPAPEFLPVSESCPVRPNNPYSASKAAADLLGVQHFLADQTDTVMARPFNHAGPRQGSNYVLSALARQVAEVEGGLKTRVEVGNLDIVRDFTDVRDVVRGYVMLAKDGESGEIYNLGTGQGTKLADALDFLARRSEKPIEVFVDPARVRPVDQPLLIADSTKLQRRTGWKPGFSIEQTLEDMLNGWRTFVRESSC